MTDSHDSHVTPQPFEAQPNPIVCMEHGLLIRQLGEKQSMAFDELGEVRISLSAILLKLDDFKKHVERTDRVLSFGNGRPPMTERVSHLETELDRLDRSVAELVIFSGKAKMYLAFMVGGGSLAGASISGLISAFIGG